MHLNFQIARYTGCASDIAKLVHLVLECTEWFEQIEKWWSQYVPASVEETGSLLVDMLPVLVLGDEDTLRSLSATPDASQMKHGVGCVGCGDRSRGS